MTTNRRTDEVGEALNDAELADIWQDADEEAEGIPTYRVDVVKQLVADNRRLRRALQGDGAS